MVKYGICRLNMLYKVASCNFKVRYNTKHEEMSVDYLNYTLQLPYQNSFIPNSFITFVIVARVTE